MLQQRGNQQQGNAESAEKTNNLAPSISLPKGGGAIRGIDSRGDTDRDGPLRKRDP